MVNHLCLTSHGLYAGDSTRGVRVTPTAVQVVVADDDDDIRDLVELKLTQSGYTVRACANGVEALEEIRRDPPTLAVLDVMMPGLSGIDVLREVRADEALKGVLV